MTRTYRPRIGSMEFRLYARFHNMVDINGPVPTHVPNLGSCHVWTGARCPDGVGKITIEGRTEYAPTVSIYLNDGIWPEDSVLHHCDNRSCVRRSHLFEGTTQDNMADMVAKGRQCLGEKNGTCKLTEVDVREILRTVTPDFSWKEKEDLGKRYNVSSATIHLISKRKLWKHIVLDPGESA